MLRRLFLPALALISAFALGQTPTWDQLKAVYSYEAGNSDSVKTQDRTAAEGSYTEFSFPSENGSTAYGSFARPNGKGPFPLVVLLHGMGGGRKMMMDSLGKGFLAKGFAVMAVDAPHNGDRATDADRKALQETFMKFAMAKDHSQGLGGFMYQDNAAGNTKFVTEAVEGGVRDIRRALDWAIAPGHRVDGTHVGTLGVSMGAIMASILSGVDDRINASALIIGGDPIAPYINKVPADQQPIAAAASPSLYLGHSTAHVLMLNGYNDTVMTRADTLRLFESAPGAMLTFFDTPGDAFSGFGHSIPAEGYAFATDWLGHVMSIPKPATRAHAKPLVGG